jgi:putative hydrolase of the HAD superfamily
LGGVLVEINHTWKGALLDAGLSDIAGKHDCPLTDFELFNSYQKGSVSFEGYLNHLCARFGGIESSQAESVHNAILRSTYPGIPELIDEIKAQGIQTGCLSNTNAPHWEAMMHAPRLAVVSKLDFPIASHLIGAEKPDEKMYRAFENASGAKPNEIVYFDDGQQNVRAAEKLGWNAFVVGPAGDPAHQMRRTLIKFGWLK